MDFFYILYNIVMNYLFIMLDNCKKKIMNLKNFNYFLLKWISYSIFELLYLQFNNKIKTNNYINLRKLNRISLMRFV